MAFIFTRIYDSLRGALNGSAVIKGVKFGFVLALIYGASLAGLSGVFNLPETIWAWWAAEGFVIYCIGGAALGWYVGKFGSD
jgi:hypothetical protein